MGEGLKRAFAASRATTKERRMPDKPNTERPQRTAWVQRFVDDCEAYRCAQSPQADQAREVLAYLKSLEDRAAAMAPAAMPSTGITTAEQNQSDADVADAIIKLDLMNSCHPDGAPEPAELIARHRESYAQTRIKPLVEALGRAREDMLGWQSYASDYFKEKHDAAADIAAIDQALAQGKALQGE